MKTKEMPKSFNIFYGVNEMFLTEIDLKETQAAQALSTKELT